MRIRHLAYLLAFPLAAAPLAAQGSDPRVARIDSLFAALLPSPSTGPGCAVGIRHDGEVVYRRGFGLADLATRTPITPQSVFYTGSISKQFTAISIAMASRDGVIDLDAPANRWITELPPMASAITVRQMVHHTSGLREKWDLLAMKGVPTTSTVVTQRMVLDLVERQRALNFTPGTRYAYNNTAYDLLATLLERATDKSIRTFSDERIFRPLGMSRTLFGDRFGESITDKVMGYSRDGNGWQESPALVETVGSGSLYSTLDDMLLWAASFETGLLGDTALQRMVETPGSRADGTALNYAFGLQVGELGGKKRIGHGGALVGYRTAIVRLPEERWAGVALCNYAQASPEQWINAAALKWLDLPRQPNDDVDELVYTPLAPPPAPISEELLGRYHSEELDADWTIVREGDAMVLRRPGMADIPFTVGTDGDLRVGGWRIEVDHDPSGQVLALLVGSGRSQGIAFERVR